MPIEILDDTHENAGGVLFNKADLQDIIAKCNKKLPIDQLCTIHTVDWALEASDLKKSYVQEVAENYAVWGNTVPEPLFAITNIHINASKIIGYGERNSFIRFVYNGIPFIKKYCPAADFDNMTLAGRNTIGVNKKNLTINIIGQFVLNSFEDKVNPEVKILFFDSEENLDYVEPQTQEDDCGEPKKKVVVDDDDFDW